MRILYVLNATASNGGATKSFLAMADAVEQDGHEIAVLVPAHDGITPTLIARGWKVLVEPYGYSALPTVSTRVRDLVRFVPRLIRNAVINAKARKKALCMAREWKVDLVHDNTSVTGIGDYVARKLGVPHVTHIREYGWYDFRIAVMGLKKRLAAPYSYAVAITSRLAEFRGRGMASGHMRTVYNGIVKEIPSSYSLHKDSFLFYAGRITANKGVVDLMEAYMKYASTELMEGRTPLRLLLAGHKDSTGLVENLTSRLRERCLDRYVEWLGSIDNVADYYGCAAACVIPSYNEGFGRVMPEAMAAGCLCVVRNSAGLAEQLENGRRLTGREIALSFRTKDQLVGCMKRIALSMADGHFPEDGEFAAMIEDGRQTVGSLYTNAVYGEKILEFYKDIMRDQKDR